MFGLAVKKIQVNLPQYWKEIRESAFLVEFSNTNSLYRVTTSHNKWIQYKMYVAAKMDLEKLALWNAGEMKRFKFILLLSKQIAHRCLRYVITANIIYVLGNSCLHLPVN